ncbi:MAG: translation initiation factor IF-3, partial [Betaproteobacteria bacterium]|nr:translation initiation factor IF-3 [Betaproteobacteria bacterium]
EITHQELGMAMLERIKADTAELALVEQMPKLEGRQMIMMLSPKKKK